jgi:hypothetical protein
MRDGIAGREVSWQSVPNGNEAFQYALGTPEQGRAVAIYRRRADERGTYGGWRWEASAPDEPLLVAQSEADLRAKAEREAAARRADEAEQRRLANAEAKRKRDLENAEKARRAAEVIAQREADKKAEIDAAVDDFALGQEPPAPVDRKVSTDQAAGQGNVFDAPVRDDNTVGLRKRLAILKQLRECLQS